MRAGLKFPVGDAARAGEDEVGQAAGTAAASAVAAVMPQDAVPGGEVGDLGQLSTLDTHEASVPALDFDELYRKHQRHMVRYAAAILHAHEHDVQDAVGEAWKVALEKSDRLQPGQDPLAWLLTIVRYAAMDVAKEYAHRAVPVDVDTLPDTTSYLYAWAGTPYPGLTSPETHEALERVWPALAEQEQVAVWAYHVGGYNGDETARLLDVSLGTAARARARGLGKVRGFFAGTWRWSRRCRRCGWSPWSIGHRTSCGR